MCGKLIVDLNLCSKPRIADGYLWSCNISIDKDVYNFLTTQHEETLKIMTKSES